MLEVRSSGGKTFYQRYRDERGKERQIKIGPWPLLSVYRARQKAKSLAAEAVLGGDPLQKLRDLRQIPSLSDFVRDRYLPFVKCSKRSWQTDETLFRIHILPRLGPFPLDLITNSEVTGVLERMRNDGYASGTINRVIVLLRFAFNLAGKWGVTGAVANPTTGLRTAPDVCRERYLTETEVARLLAALALDANQNAARAIHLLLLTGARRNEITQAKWDQINWSSKTLLVPVSKSGRPRVITLSDSAMEVLRRLPHQEGNPFVFALKATHRPPQSLHFPWRRIRARAGLPDIRLHDLRHSFASFLVNRGVSLYVVQALLGHSQPRMTQRYAHLAQQTLSDAANLASQALGQAKVQVPIA